MYMLVECSAHTLSFSTHFTHTLPLSAHSMPSTHYTHTHTHSHSHTHSTHKLVPSNIGSQEVLVNVQLDGGVSEQKGGGAPQQDTEAAVPEKLADDDGPKDPLWKRIVYRVFPNLQRSECIAGNFHWVKVSLSGLESVFSWYYFCCTS